jgi:hypothetical protein
MSITNGYATLPDVKAALRIEDSVDDSLIELSIEAASRQIDAYCQRVFYSTSATRLYIPGDSYTCQTDDIVSITSLKTSTDGVAFLETWQPSDYQLQPLNNLAGGIVTPATRIRAIGNYLFPSLVTPQFSTNTISPNFATVQIQGVFGWSAIPVAIKQACVILSMRQFKRYDSPLGVAGFGDMGVMRVGKVDPDVEALISTYAKVSYA